MSRLSKVAILFQIILVGILLLNVYNAFTVAKFAVAKIMAETGMAATFGLYVLLLGQNYINNQQDALYREMSNIADNSIKLNKELLEELNKTKKPKPKSSTSQS